MTILHSAVFRRRTVLLILLLNLCAFGKNGFSDAANMRPNVLFIISDDLTAEALGCYGNKQCRTPNIDDLAKQGVLFTRAYCQYGVVVFTSDHGYSLGNQGCRSDAQAESCQRPRASRNRESNAGVAARKT